jgi:predicted permease
LLNISLDPHQINYDQPQTESFYRDLEARVAALPGVESVSLASFIPIESPPSRHAIYIEGRAVARGEPPVTILFNRVDVDAGYFSTLQIPILRGRAFASTDDAAAPAVAIVNQTMAARFWPHQDPIGKRFSLTGDSGPYLEVVGLMQDGKYLSIGEDLESYFAVPLLQNYVSSRVLQIRSSLTPAVLSGEARREIQSLGPGMPVLLLQTMKEAVTGAKGLFLYRLGAALAASLAVLGLLLASVGVYGIVSYATAQRTQEIGIRIALGAGSRDISALVLGGALRWMLSGVLAGLAGAWALTRIMGHNLFGVTSTDPVTYSASAALIAAVALVACWIPFRRAVRVDPVVALRSE